MKRIVSLLLFSFLFASSFAQDLKETHLNMSFVKSGFSDSWKLATSPLQWETKDAAIFGGVILGGIALYTVDEPINDFFQKNKNETTEFISKHGFEPIGSGMYSLAFVGGLYGVGLLAKNNRLESFALNTAKAVVINGVITLGVKHLTHRHRPFQDGIPDSKKWDGPMGDTDYTSFFSGHTMMAFTIATAFATEYSDKKWIPITAYTLASLAGISRIHDNKHWASDIFMAAAFSYFSTKYIFKLNQNNKTSLNPEISSIYGQPVLSFKLKYLLN